MSLKSATKKYIPKILFDAVRGKFKPVLPPYQPPVSSLGFAPHDAFGLKETKAVPVSTVAPFHNSIGDISTGQVTQNYLSAVGIPSYSTSFWDSSQETIVIGGGEIIGFGSHGWGPIKRKFLPRGNHILNAIGYDIGSGSAKDLDVLKDYRYVSVRDELIAEQLGKYCEQIAIVPCPATLQYGIPLEVIKALPRFEFLRSLEESDYVVIHRHPKMEMVAQRLRKQNVPLVVVDMQAHAKHPWDTAKNDFIVPTGLHSPEIIQGLVNSAHAVMTVSLHLAIFAIGASKPFSAISDETPQSAKVRRYLRRARLERMLGDQRDDLLSLAYDNKDLLLDASKREREKTLCHLQSVAQAI